MRVVLCVWALLAAGQAAAATTDERGARASAGTDKVLYQKQHGPTRGYHMLLINDREFGDFVFEADLRCPASVTHYGLVFRYKDDRNFYRLVLRPPDEDFRVEKVVGKSNYATARHVRFPFRANRWYHVRLVARGPHVEVWIDGKQVCSRDGFAELTSGGAGVTVFDRAAAEFDDLRITTPDGKKELFRADFDDGRLGGWVPVGAKGVKGEWAVAPKIEKMESQKHFVEHYTFHACGSMGRNQTIMDFPGIMTLRDGSLLTIFIEENQHGTPPWAAMPSSGKLWMTRSTDMGRTWSTPAPFLDTPIDDRHAYTLQLANGDLLAFWWVQTVAFGMGGEFNFVSRSTDGGATWGDPARIRSGKPARPNKVGIKGGFSLTVPPIELPDGALAIPIHCLSSVDRVPPEIGLLRSHDGGRTWGDYSTIAYDPKGRISFVEPAVVRLRSGKWIAVTRTEVPIYPDKTHPYTLGPTMTCTSTDEGRTWTKAERLPLDFTWQGSTAPFILQTQTGVVVFAVNTGTAFSYDDGKTWVPQAVSCGYYPNLMEIAPGTIASVGAGMGGRVFSLTKPKAGQPPAAGKPTPRDLGVPKPRPAARAASPLRAVEPRGMFRAVRVRDPRGRDVSPLLAQPKHLVLAVARAAADGGDIIVGVLRSPERRWSPPFLVAKAAGISGDPVVAQACDGTILCAFPAGPVMMAATSRDGGATWSPPTRTVVRGGQERFVFTSPPVEDAEGSWLVAATNGILGSKDGGTTWRRLAQCPGAGAGGKRLVEPSLAVARNGRWVVLARQVDPKGKGDALAVMVSSDRGKTWGKPRVTKLRGHRPEIVELFESLFIAVAEGGDGRLHAAFAWDELHHFQVQPLSCGYCVRASGGKHLARGSGADVAGEFNNLPQVPLLPGEAKAAKGKATARLAASDGAFTLKGEWERTEAEPGGEAVASADSAASVEVKFDGPTVVLVHDMAPDGRLVGVRINGHEYPPVDMKGKARSGVRTCLAADLVPGRHKLSLWCLLRWRAGKMTLRAIEVAEKGRRHTPRTTEGK